MNAHLSPAKDATSTIDVPSTLRFSRIRFPAALAVVLACFTLIGAGCKDEKPRLGGFCEDDTSCPSQQICLDGYCAATCADTTDCVVGFSCINNICYPDCDTRATCFEGPRGQWGCVENTCQPLDPPGLASTGGPRQVNEGEVVVLDGTSSSQPLLPNDATYSWQYVSSQPMGYEIPLEAFVEIANKSDTVEAGAVKFTAPSVTQDVVLYFELTLRNAAGEQSADGVAITVRNTINEPPTATLNGPSAPVEAGAEIKLSAAESSDPNPDTTLTYAWSALGAEIEFTDASAEGDWSEVKFFAPFFEVDTDITIRVVVSDGSDSVTAEWVITVLAATSPPACTPESCDDNDPCTTDLCDPRVGCSSSPIECDDNNACTIDACVGGECAFEPIGCEFEEECKYGLCDPAQGCVVVVRPSGFPCAGAQGMCNGQASCAVAMKHIAPAMWSGAPDLTVEYSSLFGIALSDGQLWTLGDLSGYGEGENFLMGYGFTQFSPGSTDVGQFVNSQSEGSSKVALDDSVALVDGGLFLLGPDGAWSFDEQLTWKATGWGWIISASSILLPGEEDSEEEATRAYIIAVQGEGEVVLVCQAAGDEWQCDPVFYPWDSSHTIFTAWLSATGSAPLATPAESFVLTHPMGNLAVCPSSGSCFSAHDNTGCDDKACCLTICAGDSFCCNTSWDSVCANSANSICEGGIGEGGESANEGGEIGEVGEGGEGGVFDPAVCPSEASCTEPHEGVGCDDEECCLAVCKADTFCCNTSWDNLCADAAIAGCGGPVSTDAAEEEPMVGLHIWHTANVSTAEVEWSDTPPTGCNPTSEPCSGAFKWIDTVRLPDGTAWALATPNVLAHFNGQGWEGMPLGGYSALGDVNLRAVAVGDGLVFVFAQGPGCGIVCQPGANECTPSCEQVPEETTQFMHILLVYDLAAGQWLPARLLGTFTCGSAAISSGCWQGNSSFAIHDAAFDPKLGLLGIVGSHPGAGESEYGTQQLQYWIDFGANR